MLVQSTGLGKTVLTANFADLIVNEDNKEFGLGLKIEATEPVHWYITCHLSGADIRGALKMALKPGIMVKVIKLLLQKQPVEIQVKSEGQKSHG